MTWPSRDGTVIPQSRCSWSGSEKATVPSATRLASVAPVNTLVIEPIRIRVSPSGSLSEPSAILPKPITAVSPSLITPSTRPGTPLSR